MDYYEEKRRTTMYKFLLWIPAVVLGLLFVFLTVDEVKWRKDKKRQDAQLDRVNQLAKIELL